MNAQLLDSVRGRLEMTKTAWAVKRLIELIEVVKSLETSGERANLCSP